MTRNAYTRALVREISGAMSGAMSGAISGCGAGGLYAMEESWRRFTLPISRPCTIVLKGRPRVKTEQGELTVAAGQAVVANAGEWAQYSSPHAEGAEYIAVCVPAFSPDTVHRDKSHRDIS